jgi:hypothetical protein
MKYPEGYLWADPGFFSIAVSYLKTNDFFFSGHVGVPVIIGLEFKNMGIYSMFYFSLFTICFEAFTMVVTRGHYCIDLITGVIVAHYIYIHVEKNIDYIDKLWFNYCERRKDEEETLKDINL